jgi:hypothetical protein
MVDSLPGLDDGEAWVCSPHWLARHGYAPIQRVRFRQRSTFDSGATPTLKQRRKPTELADIDLGALLGRMEAVTEKAAQDDPRALRQRIATLERQVRTTKPADSGEVARLAAENADLRHQLAVEQAKQPETVEVPLLHPGDTAAIEQIITALRSEAGSLELALGRAASRPAPPAPVPAARKPVAVPAPRPQPAQATVPTTTTGVLSKAQRAVLTVLAQFPDGRTKRQLAMLAGYSAKGGGFNNSLSSLRTAGYIGRGEPITVTDAGLEALGDWEPLPEGPALVAHWMGQLGKAESLALSALLDAWPNALTKAEIAERAGYAPDGGGFNNALSRLRTLQLIDGRGEMRADETLAQQASEAVA